MKHKIIRLSNEGETVLAEWTPGVKKEERAAEKVFNEIMRTGEIAVTPTEPAWKKTIRVDHFDPKIEEMLVIRPITGG